MGDLNAKYQLFEVANNPKGKHMETINRLGRINPRGPTFTTFIGGNYTTKHDKVFTNQSFYYSLHLKQGPVTTSDHLPIIAIISSNPLQILIKTRFSYRTANWEDF